LKLVSRSAFELTDALFDGIEFEVEGTQTFSHTSCPGLIGGRPLVEFRQQGCFHLFRLLIDVLYNSLFHGG